MAYTKRLVFSVGDDVRDIAKQIVDKHKGTVFVESGFSWRAFSDLDDSGLLTIVGHGSESAIGEFEDDEPWSARDLAKVLILGGLRKVKMITLVGCHLGAGKFARGLHSALARGSGVKVFTQVNARTGLSIVVRGKQYSAAPEIKSGCAETVYFREKIGTKILYYWQDGQQQSQTRFEGYTDEGVEPILNPAATRIDDPIPEIPTSISSGPTPMDHKIQPARKKSLG